MSESAVVIVDDEEDQRLLLHTVLPRDGSLRVVGEAANGAEAVEVVRRARPDLVLLDLAMPVMDGLAAIPAIRAVAPESVIVVLSHLPRERGAPAALAAGVAGYIEKTTPIDRLADEVLIAAGLLDAVQQAVARARRNFPPDPTSARAARGFVVEMAARWSCEALLDELELLTSEVVTNAVVHGGTDLDVGVLLLPDRVRVEVGDRSADEPVPRAATPEATSGRGLELVETLASAWGTAPGLHGKTVWFELDRPAPAG